MRRVLVDTSAFFALAVIEGPNHVRARDLFAEAGQKSWRLITTNAVVFETHALLLNRSRPGREKALEFLDLIGTGALQVVRVNKRDEGVAIAVIRTHADKHYSLCDALSFVVMERLRIRDAISFDQDFRSYGRFSIL